MRDGNQIILGSGRYFQSPGAINLVGREVRLYADSALIVAGKISSQITKDAVETSLKKSGVTFATHIFTGFCSENTVNAIVNAAKVNSSKLILAVGGGKCMDAAKLAAGRLGIRIITVPTSVSTCAAYATVCVKYDDTGTPIGNEYCEMPVAGIVVDTDIISSNCPARMLAAGIADAMAKLPEIYFSVNLIPDINTTVMPLIALKIAGFNTDTYFANSIQAITDVQEKKLTAAVDDVVFTNLALTGLTSQLSSGSKQLAIAHAFYDGVSKYFKVQRLNHLHGEIVACGIPVQLAVNGYKEDYIQKNLTFLRSIGAPVCFSELGIDPTPENLEILLDYIFASINITDNELKANIRKNFSLVMK